MVMKPGKIKRSNKDDKIYVGRSTAVHNLLFCTHKLCMSHEPFKRFYWLVPRSLVNNYCVLCMVMAKKANKN